VAQASELPPTPSPPSGAGWRFLPVITFTMAQTRELTESDLTTEELKWLLMMGDRKPNKVYIDNEGKKYIECYTPRTPDKKERVYLLSNRGNQL